MNIIAIGGGDKQPAINTAMEVAPGNNVLIIPTACSTEKAYNRKVSACVDFFSAMGLPNTVLHDFDEPPSKTKVEEEFGRAGLIYTIGGNMPALLNRAHSTTTIGRNLRNAVKRGVPHAGTSAGALYPFRQAHSCVSPRPAEEFWDYQYLRGLNFLNATATAHAEQYDPILAGQVTAHRTDSRMQHLINTGFPNTRIAFAIENNAALIVRDDETFALSAVAGATVHHLEWAGGVVLRTPLGDREPVSPELHDFLTRPLSPKQ